MKTGERDDTFTPTAHERYWIALYIMHILSYYIFTINVPLDINCLDDGPIEDHVIKGFFLRDFKAHFSNIILVDQYMICFLRSNSNSSNIFSISHLFLLNAHSIDSKLIFIIPLLIKTEHKPAELTSCLSHEIPWWQ